MIAVDRLGERLLVSQGPSGLYKAATCVWPIGVAIAALVGFDALLALGWASATVGGLFAAPLAFTLALLQGWSTTVHRFDRVTGMLRVAHKRPLGPTRTREVPFALVSAVVDRRARDRRSIELVLVDRSVLVVARAHPARALALDRVAREVSQLLCKSVELAAGAVFDDRYQIERMVAQGGMGVVYRARDRNTQRPVALKLLLSAGDATDRQQRFAREIRLLAGLEHPRIARHLGHGVTAEGQAFLVMEWLEGEDLASALARGPLSLADSAQVLTGACEALAVAHAQGIVHRDLKPGNLFLRGGSAADVVLLDFGVARRVSSETRLTATTALIGTPYYMAPEQASSAREIAQAADVFSLGCIVYECLTGRHPFEAAQLAGVLARILYDNPQPVTALNPAVPAAWAELLARMLNKDPTRRPADGATLLRELAALPPAEPATDLARSGSDMHAKPRRTSAPSASEAGVADQVLVCVVLASPANAFTPDAIAQGLESIRSAMGRFGCPIERLVDGSLLATVLPRHSAADQVRIAARCALDLGELLPSARIAIATGRAPLRGAPYVGDAVDRAAQLLELRGPDERAREPVSPDGGSPRESIGPRAQGIRLDLVSAQLLDPRFITSRSGDRVLLLGERPELDESRPLLGKPTPCVGREVELLQLEGMVADAIEHASAKAAVVVGPPGIGKSRLRHELQRRLRERYPRCALLTGHGDPLSAGSPHVLLGDALRRHAGIRLADEPARARTRVSESLCLRIEPGERQRVSEFLGELAGVPFPAEPSPPLAAARGDHRVMSEQIQAAFLDWSAAESAVHPVGFVLDDVQWGDALTLKLLEAALRERGSGGPGCGMFVIALGRPELEDLFPKLLGEHRVLALSLGALSPRASTRLAKDVLGDAIGSDSVARIVRQAAGNALFLEELIRAAADGKTSEVPETVLAMLQARLSRLSPDLRQVLRAASVFGETFWGSGVREICEMWGNADDAEHRLQQLTELELIAPLRTSRFPDDVEYVFRHALVCDAAHGLLVDADRDSGHRTAADWLVAKGETDGVVLARHAEEAGDREQAGSHYARAAEQSLRQYDFGEALTRAKRAIALGAQGEALGTLESVQSSALFNMGQWTEAAEHGRSALALLPKGGASWWATAELLLQLLPNVGDFERSQQLSELLLRVTPAPDAQKAYLCALCVQLLGHSISGAREQGQICLDFIARLDLEAAPHSLVTRGYGRLWRSVFTFILGYDWTLALRLAEGATQDLAASQVMYRLSLAHTVQAFTWWGLGDPERSQRAAREGHAIATQIRDDYHAALAAWYLGLSLSEQPEQAELAEAERCAQAMVQLQRSPLFEATSRVVTAGVALARGDFARAETEAGAARAGLSALPPYGLIASSHLINALLRQRRAAEAAAIAQTDLAALARIGSPVCSEVLFRVAAAEALFAAGARDDAASALRSALAQIELRTRLMGDPELRARHLGRPENRRALALGESWLGVAPRDT